jgi:Flp pilus assembly protein TadD
LFLILGLLLFAADPATTDPNQAKTLLQRGLLALQHGQLTEARSDLEDASRLDDQNAFVWASLADTYLRLGNEDKAEAAASKAAETGQNNPVVVHALSLFYFKYADALLHRQDFTHAADVLTAALKQNPSDAQLVLALGVARYGQRRFDEAIVQFLKVIQIDPSIEQPYIFIAKMLDQAGPHLEEITKDYEAWNARDPKNAQAPLVLAKALLIGGSQGDRAAELLRKSIELDPNNWEAHYELGVLLANRRDYQGAATELVRSIELNGKEAMPHYHLARVYDRLGEPEKAKAEREIHQRLIGAETR